MKPKTNAAAIEDRREINYYWKALQAARRGEASYVQWSRMESKVRLFRG
jgi:hypothetical protein